MEDGTLVAAAFDSRPEVAWLRLLLTELVVATEPGPEDVVEDLTGRRDAKAANVSSKDAVETSLIPPPDKKLLLSFLVSPDIVVVAAAVLGSDETSTKLTSPPPPSECRRAGQGGLELPLVACCWFLLAASPLSPRPSDTVSEKSNSFEKAFFDLQALSLSRPAVLKEIMSIHTESEIKGKWGKMHDTNLLLYPQQALKGLRCALPLCQQTGGPSLRQC